MRLTSTVSATGFVAHYLNGSYAGGGQAEPMTWARLAARPSCIIRSHQFGAQYASVHWWDRALTTAEVAALSSSGLPKSICASTDATCVYFKATWGSFFPVAPLFAGHQLNTLLPAGAPPAGYMVLQTQVDSVAANAGLNPASWEFDWTDPRNFRGGGPTDVAFSDSMASPLLGGPMDLTIALWLMPHFGASTGTLLDWRATDGSSRITLTRTLGTLQYAWQPPSSNATLLTVPLNFPNQWLHAVFVHNSTAGQVQAYVNGQLYQTKPMPPLVRAPRPLVTARGLSMTPVASLHFWLSPLSAVEVGALFVSPPDSLYRAPLTLQFSPAPGPGGDTASAPLNPPFVAVPDSATVFTARVTLPLPWPLNAPLNSSLQLMLDDCGSGLILSPTNKLLNFTNSNDTSSLAQTVTATYSVQNPALEAATEGKRPWYSMAGWPAVALDVRYSSASSLPSTAEHCSTRK